MGDADSCVGEGDGVQGEAGGGDAAVEDTADWYALQECSDEERETTCSDENDGYPNRDSESAFHEYP